MSVTFGFYNAVEVDGVYDRIYSSEDLSSIFDGLVNDGVYASIGSCFSVTPGSNGTALTVGTGRAWFNHTWTYNDAPILLENISAPDTSLTRIDAVIIDINRDERTNSITIVTGSPSISPVRPTLIHEADHDQYALAYVNIRPSETQTVNILSTDITYVVGTDETKFVNAIIDTMSVEMFTDGWRQRYEVLLQQLRDQLEQLNSEQAWERAKLMYRDVEVDVDAFILENPPTYPDYPYKATIEFTGSGITANDIPEVVYGLDDAISGMFSPVCNTVDGGVCIYSSNTPLSSVVTIPTIYIWKGNSSTNEED